MIAGTLTDPLSLVLYAICGVVSRRYIVVLGLALGCAFALQLLVFALASSQQIQFAQGQFTLVLLARFAGAIIASTIVWSLVRLIRGAKKQETKG